jgi:S-adenosylmethionine-diacylgycerolhomoserine-N-methlytransferase
VHLGVVLESAPQPIELNHVTKSREHETHESLAGYYRLHSKFYDLTRWSFLFGRSSLVPRIAKERIPNRILEVGCGTGTNLAGLANAFPEAELFGLDLSKDMLQKARRKLALHESRTLFVHRAYNEPVCQGQPFDLILFSYSLSMFNPGWEQALDAAGEDLADSGIVAAVDFHDTPFAFFARWMAMNHVRLGGHLLKGLRDRFAPLYEHTGTAWFGVWKYFQFIGIKSQSRSDSPLTMGQS